VAQPAVVRRAFLRVVFVDVVHRLPLDCWIVAFVDVARTTDARGKGVQLALHSVPFGVRARAQLGFG
jgi:hypothetical protein